MKIIAFKIAALAVLAATTACVAAPPRDNSGADTSAGAAPTPLTCSYVIDGEIFTLTDGSAQRAITAESASKTSVMIHGEPAFGDIDGDGDADAVLILVKDSGGSGTFYYGALAVKSGAGYRGTDAVLLGDRVAVQEYGISNNRARIRYAVRAPGEPFSAAASTDKRLDLQYDEKNQRLVRVAVDFEGEADPAMMTLTMHTWTWIRTNYNNDTQVTPVKASVFTLAFRDDGSWTATTDCNSLRGSYELTENRITFGPVMSTRMHCEGSQEGVFIKMLEQFRSYFFTSRGELIFDLKVDSGSAVFRQAAIVRPSPAAE